jgi:hypothetical protein
MTEIQKMLVQVAQKLNGGQKNWDFSGSRTQPVVTVHVTLERDFWDTLHMVVSQLENGEYKPEEATPTVETRLEALEKNLQQLHNYVDGLPGDERVREIFREEQMEGNDWKDYLRDLVSKAVDDVDLDGYVDTYLRDRGVERYMDPEAMRHEIEVVVCEVLAGAAALAKPAAKRFGVRKIGGGS